MNNSTGTAAVLFVDALNLVQGFELHSQSMQILGCPVLTDKFKDEDSCN